MPNRLLICLIATIVSLVLPTSHAVAFDVGDNPRSATLARDLNGFTLGDHIEHVARTARLTALGSGDYDGWHNGIEYDFGVTPLGRVYRIGMEQKLENFSDDAVLIQSFEQRLFAKYGQPSTAGRNPWSWRIIEVLQDAYGSQFVQKTNWAYAMISSHHDGAYLSTKMLDFRILWQDQATVSQGPRDRALDAVQF